jgi:hypothetical protein
MLNSSLFGDVELAVFSWPIVSTALIFIQGCRAGCFSWPAVIAAFIPVRGVQSWLSFHGQQLMLNSSLFRGVWSWLSFNGLLLVLHSSLSRDAELAVFSPTVNAEFISDRGV